jgi:large subunit ribosomal protein L23
MEISIKPIVTEKAVKLSESLNRYTFRVSPEANKLEIKKLVEELYGVKVTKVNTMIVRRKRKQRYTKGGLIKGTSALWKKALVSVADGQTIDFYSNI